jgi:hypothetical protein
MTDFWDVTPCSLVEVQTFQRCVLPPSSGRPLKCLSASTRLHGATSQKAVIIFTLAAMRTWNLTGLYQVDYPRGRADLHVQHCCTQLGCHHGICFTSGPGCKVSVSNIIGHLAHTFNICVTWPPWRAGQRHVPPRRNPSLCWGTGASTASALAELDTPCHKGRLHPGLCSGNTDRLTDWLPCKQTNKQTKSRWLTLWGHFFSGWVPAGPN